MFRKLLTTLYLPLFLLLLAACGPQPPRILKNEAIPQAIRTETRGINDKLFRAVSRNDARALKELMSDTLLQKHSEGVETLIENASGSFDARTYRVLDQFYQNSPFPEKADSLFTDSLDGYGYTIHFKPLNPETYICLLAPEEENQEILFCAIYGRYGPAWKLNTLYFGILSMYGKRAPDYYSMAKTAWDKHYLSDAVNYADLARICLHPGGELFHYKQEKEIEDFALKVHARADSTFRFPLVLENIKSKPALFRIFPEVSREGFFPMVYYKTQIPLENETALRQEYQEVKSETARIYTGIDKDKKYVFYRAYSDYPSGENEPAFFGFVDQVYGH